MTTLKNTRTELYQRAMTEAKSIGLLYWPALIDDGARPAVDPMAYVYAEQVLIPKYGEWSCANIETDYPCSIYAGGWGSHTMRRPVWGHTRSICRQTVANMWLVAGCKNNTKFKLQVASGITARKSDRISFLKDFIAGYEWLESTNRPYAVHGPNDFSRKAIAYLGKLPIELRYVATWGFHRFKATPITVNGLNLDQVEKAKVNPKACHYTLPIEILLDQEPELRQAVDVEKAASAYLCPAYPALAYEDAQYIASGLSPVDLYRGQIPDITANQAHVFATLGLSPAEAHNTLLANTQATLRTKHQIEANLSSLKVARWLLALCEDPRRKHALYSEREMRIGDEVMQFNFLSFIEDIHEHDIDSINDGANRVFGIVLERYRHMNEPEQPDSHDVLCVDPDWLGKLPNWVTKLNTPAQLVAEGRALRSCLGSYSGHLMENHVILAIKTKHGNSTAWISDEGAFLDHKGKCNREPPTRHTRWLHAWLKKYSQLTAGISDRRDTN